MASGQVASPLVELERCSRPEGRNNSVRRLRRLGIFLGRGHKLMFACSVLVRAKPKAGVWISLQYRLRNFPDPLAILLRTGARF